VVLVAPQIATSGLPSAVPPNHADIMSPFFSSTTVEAWLAANGAEPGAKMASFRGSAGAPASELGISPAASMNRIANWNRSLNAIKAPSTSERLEPGVTTWSFPKLVSSLDTLSTSAWEIVFGGSTAYDEGFTGCGKTLFLEGYGLHRLRKTLDVEGYGLKARTLLTENRSGFSR
jgi:hypothetical protein